ncbi:hypothetical protein ACOMHN_042916 [Nucella lapillus]
MDTKFRGLIVSVCPQIVPPMSSSVTKTGCVLVIRFTLTLSVGLALSMALAIPVVVAGVLLEKRHNWEKIVQTSISPEQMVDPSCSLKDQLEGWPMVAV